MWAFKAVVFILNIQLQHAPSQCVIDPISGSVQAYISWWKFNQVVLDAFKESFPSKNCDSNTLIYSLNLEMACWYYGYWMELLLLLWFLWWVEQWPFGFSKKCSFNVSIWLILSSQCYNDATKMPFSMSPFHVPPTHLNGAFYVSIVSSLLTQNQWFE